MQFYIDPGTESMLFTVLVGALGAGIYGCRKLLMKLRFAPSGEKKRREITTIFPLPSFQTASGTGVPLSPSAKNWKYGDRLLST